MTDKEQRLPINKEEVDIIKSTFKDNDYLLKAIRALFFGLEVTDQERELVKSTFADQMLLKCVKSRFLPEIDKDSPIGQVNDVWLGVEQMVFGQSKETIYQAVNYKKDAIEMTKKALALLVDPYGEQPNVTFNPSIHINDEYQINLLARNQYMRHVEQQLLMLKVIAEQKDSKSEDIKERAKKDSVR